MKLTPAQRYKIGRKGAEIGVTAAIWYYKKATVPRFIINGTNCETIEEFVSERINNRLHS